MPFGVVVNNLNVEYARDVGLRVERGARQSTGLIINSLYSELNSTALHASDVALRLTGQAGGGRVVLRDCYSSVIDIAQSSHADVLLEGSTSGCMTYLPLTEPSRVRYEDDSTGCNTFMLGTAEARMSMPAGRDVLVLSDYHREGVVHNLSADAALRFEASFATRECLPFFVTFYPPRS